MQPDDVWVVRLYFCFDGKEAFAVEGDLYGRLDFKNGEVKEYVFHANHTSYPEHEQGFLALSDNEIDLEFVTIDTNGRETTVQAGETCRVEVVSTRQTKKPFLLRRRSPRLMAGGQGCILNTSTNRCWKAKKGEADELKAPIFVDASKTRAGLDAFLGKHGGVLQGGQGRTKKPFLRRSPRLTAGGQGCVLNKATNMCRKTKDGQVDDGNCLFNTVTGRCGKKKAAPKKKKKNSAPKKKAKEIKAVFRTKTSRTWLGGVVDVDNAQYMNTTAPKVKKAIEKLVDSQSVNIDVQRYKQTKFFAIRINWEEDDEDDEDLGYTVDFYFEEDQHNQNDKIKNLFIDGSVIEVVDPYLSFGKRTSLLATKAMKELKKVLQKYKNMTNAQGAKKAPKKKKAAPKKEIEIVCDGNKCRRRVPAKKKVPKKKRATGRLSARFYVDEMGGQAGEKVDIYEGTESKSEVKCLAYRKGKNGPVPYWAKLGSPAANKLGCNWAVRGGEETLKEKILKARSKVERLKNRNFRIDAKYKKKVDACQKKAKEWQVTKRNKLEKLQKTWDEELGLLAAQELHQKINPSREKKRRRVLNVSHENVKTPLGNFGDEILPEEAKTIGKIYDY